MNTTTELKIDDGEEVADWAERAAAAVILGECQESPAETETFLALTAEDALMVRREFWAAP